MTRLAPAIVIGEKIEENGRGRMGTAWKAYSRSLDRPCAIKMLLPGMRENDARQSARLLREARIVTRLRSPYVVTVFDVGEWEGRAVIAMELLEGATLRSHETYAAAAQDERALLRGPREGRAADSFAHKV